MESLIQNEKKHRNYSMDFLKIISSFMIVCIHFKIFGEVGEFITIIARFAVPVFFMISGYYSCNDDREKIKDKVLNILKLYFCAVVLYFCFNVAVKIFTGKYREAIWYVSEYLRIKYTAPIILFNESITAMHLWFLGALIYSYLIQYLVVRAKIKDNIIYVLSCFLLLVHLVFGIGFSVVGIETPTFLLKNYILRNFLFMGFPLFTFGRFIRKKEDAILKTVTGKYIVLFIIISVCEMFIMHGIDWKKDLYVGSLLMAFALFVIALKMKNKTYHPKLIALFGISTNVYLIHIMAGDILSMTKLENMHFYLYLRPVIIFVVSVIVSLILNWFMSLNMIRSLQKKMNCKIRGRRG